MNAYLELLHRLYRDHGLVVVGFHDNSVPAEAVRRRVEANGFKFAIGIDVDAGTTVARYAVNQYPTYFLINPDGVVVETNTLEFRVNMVETVRLYLM